MEFHCHRTILKAKKCIHTITKLKNPEEKKGSGDDD